ncbi:MAG: hypothetical protein ACE5I2_07385, partial [Anaerolineae bacterium]
RRYGKATRRLVRPRIVPLRLGMQVEVDFDVPLVLSEIERAAQRLTPRQRHAVYKALNGLPRGEKDYSNLWLARRNLKKAVA